MSDKKSSSWMDADSQWLWEERVRRQERRERIDEEDVLWVTRWNDGEIEWVRYREGPDWDTAYLEYVEEREAREEREREIVREFAGLGLQVREEGVGRGLGAHYPRPGGTPVTSRGVELEEVREEMVDRERERCGHFRLDEEGVMRRVGDVDEETMEELEWHWNMVREQQEAEVRREDEAERELERISHEWSSAEDEEIEPEEGATGARFLSREEEVELYERWVEEGNTEEEMRTKEEWMVLAARRRERLEELREVGRRMTVRWDLGANGICDSEVSSGLVVPRGDYVEVLRDYEEEEWVRDIEWLQEQEQLKKERAEMRAKEREADEQQGEGEWVAHQLLEKTEEGLVVVNFGWRAVDGKENEVVGTRELDQWAEGKVQVCLDELGIESELIREQVEGFYEWEEAERQGDWQRLAELGTRGMEDVDYERIMRELEDEGEVSQETGSEKEEEKSGEESKGMSRWERMLAKTEVASEGEAEQWIREERRRLREREPIDDERRRRFNDLRLREEIRAAEERWRLAEEERIRGDRFDGVRELEVREVMERGGIMADNGPSNEPEKGERLGDMAEEDRRITVAESSDGERIGGNRRTAETDRRVLEEIIERWGTNGRMEERAESPELEGAVGGVLYDWEREESEIRARRGESGKITARVEPVRKRGEEAEWIADWTEEEIEEWALDHWTDEARVMRRHGFTWREIGDIIGEQLEFIRWDRVSWIRRGGSHEDITLRLGEGNVFMGAGYDEEEVRRVVGNRFREEGNRWRQLGMSWAEVGTLLWARFVRQGEENRREWELRQRELAGDRVFREGESGEELAMRQLDSLLEGDRGDWWDPMGGRWVPNMVLEQRIAQEEEGEENAVWIDEWRELGLLIKKQEEWLRKEAILRWTDEHTEHWLRMCGGERFERARRNGATWQDIRDMLVNEWTESDEEEAVEREEGRESR